MGPRDDHSAEAASSGGQAIAHETYQCDGRAPADGSLFWGFPRLCGLGGVSNEFEFLPSDGSRGDNHRRLVRNDFVCERRVGVPSIGFVVHLRTSVGDLGTCLRWQSLPQTLPLLAQCSPPYSAESSSACSPVARRLFGGLRSSLDGLGSSSLLKSSEAHASSSKSAPCG